MTATRMSKEYEAYFNSLQAGVDKQYEIAAEARAKGLDPELIVEPKRTKDIAERVESMIGPPGVGDRMRELEGMERIEMGFKIAEEIALGRFGSNDRLDNAERAIRAALAIITEAVTVAPIQGIPEVKIKKHPDGTEYLAVYLAGPIRPAGGTPQALTLVIGDHVRRKLGLSPYKATDEQVGRMIEEVRLYESEVRRFQYHVTDEDLELALRMLAVEGTGVQTDPYEVANYRNISGVETNRLRGGALIVLVDGIVGRARKLIGITENLGLEGWDWLGRLGQKKVEDNGKKKPTASFMEEIIVGRPVFSFPNRPGGFRLRYGRARTTGLAAVGVHPAVMIVANGFMCTGLQLRMELPGKSASVCPVTTVEPPVVKLKDGSVLAVESEDEANRVYDDIAEILSLGDILINAGDFIQNNKKLYKAGYDENQWNHDLRAAVKELGLEGFSKALQSRIGEFINDRYLIPTMDEALELAEAGIPLHPRYTYPWNFVGTEDILNLKESLESQWETSGPGRLKLGAPEKRTMELLLIPHRVKNGLVDVSPIAGIIERCLALGKTFNDLVGMPLDVVRKI